MKLSQKTTLFGTITLLSSSLNAGDLEPLAAPTNAGSVMYTLEDVYKRLDDGTTATKESTFAEPTSGPSSGTGHTLDDVYEKADAVMKMARVPKTGQDKCYYLSDNSEETCDSTHKGQDGNYKKGVAFPNPRFTDNSDGTVTDNLTGLIWLKKANCIQTDYSSFDADGTNGDGKVTWEHALDFVKGINDGTYPNCGVSQTDWRLPNVRELHSLIDFAYYGPALSNATGTAKWTENDAFSSVQTGNYWSSTTLARGTGYAWSVDLGFSDVSAYDKSNAYCVWPVRGGQ